MLSARSLVFTTCSLIGVALFIGVLGLRQEPDSDGAGRDTYGLRAHGYRGVLELLGEVGVAGERRLAPPVADLPTETTIALLAPSTAFVGLEPAYLSDLVEWVESGGRIVVAPPVETKKKSQPERNAVPRPKLLATLGLGTIRVRGSSGDGSNKPRRNESRFQWPAGQRESRAQRVVDSRDYRWGGRAGGELTLAVPSGSTLALDPGKTDWRPLLQWDDASEDEGLLAARFPRGAGEVVVVAEPDLFANALLRQDDNSVAAVRLLSPKGGPVVFDEHYHGLSVRGNALYLLTLPGFAAMTLTLLAATGVWAWRTAVALGPPTDRPVQRRRDLGEYLNAVSRLLLRSADGRRHLLRELRSGTLEELGRQLGFAVLTPTPDKVAAALARRDRSRAEAFSSTMDALDRRLAAPGRPAVAETLQLMQRTRSCL